MSDYRIDVSDGRVKASTLRFWLPSRCLMFAAIRGYWFARRNFGRRMRVFSVTFDP